jgi:exopolyphosphatase/guanosine-5'-triphosphate,3'-diphosphate pyrophosphatase
LHTDPPTRQELDQARVTTLALLDRAAATVDLESRATWVGVAGTVTSIAAMTLGLERYDPAKTHGFELARDDVARAFDKLAAVPTAERASLLIQPQRAPIIVAGAVILLTILDRFSVNSLRVSERDILDGLAEAARLLR